MAGGRECEEGWRAPSDRFYRDFAVLLENEGLGVSLEGITVSGVVHVVAESGE